MKSVFAKFVSLAVLLAVGFAFVGCDNVEKGSMTDSRDGKTYKTVKIGDQVWMAENLNYQTGDSKCYENKPENCEKYGRLYTWNDALTACPDGWHLPSKEEFEELREVIGGLIGGGKKLKSRRGWSSFDEGESGNGSDAFGFAALPAGMYCSGCDDSGNGRGEYDYEGRGASFWSSTEHEKYKDHAHILNLNHYYEGVFIADGSKDVGFSVRCVKDK